MLGIKMKTMTASLENCKILVNTFHKKIYLLNFNILSMTEGQV